MDRHLQVVAIAATVLLLGIVLELVRRKRLLERYAIVWLLSTAALFVFAVWGGLLDRVADALGVAYPPNALFLIAFGFVILLLLNFSLAVSRLSDQSKVLAQRLALLEQRLDDSHPPGAAREDAPGEERVGV